MKRDKMLLNKLNKELKKWNTEVFQIGGVAAWEDEKTYRINNEDLYCDFDATLATIHDQIGIRINGEYKKWNRKDKNAINEIIAFIEPHVSWLY